MTTLYSAHEATPRCPLPPCLLRLLQDESRIRPFGAYHAGVQTRRRAGEAELDDNQRNGRNKREMRRTAARQVKTG